MYSHMCTLIRMLVVHACVHCVVCDGVLCMYMGGCEGV